MAATSGKKTASSKKSSSRSSTAKKTNTRSTNTRKKNTNTYQASQDSELFHEIGLIVLFVAMVILFLCNFGIIGPVGNIVSGVMFGLFGLTAYLAPVLIFLAAAFWFANAGSPTALRKILAGVVLFLMAGVVCDLIAGDAAGLEAFNAGTLYNNCRTSGKGGGVVAGSLTWLLHHYLETIGTVLVVLLCSAISFILVTEKSLISGMRESGSRMRERSLEEKEKRQEYNRQRRAEQEEARQRREEARRLRVEEKENEKILRMDKRVSGVMVDTSLPKQHSTDRRRDDIHEITLREEAGQMQELTPDIIQTDAPPAFDFEKIHIRSAHQVTMMEDGNGEMDLTEAGQENPEKNGPDRMHQSMHQSGVTNSMENGGMVWQNPEGPKEKNHSVHEMQSYTDKEEVMGNGDRDLLPLDHEALAIRVHKEGSSQAQPDAVVRQRPEAAIPGTPDKDVGHDLAGEIREAVKKPPKKYVFPSLSFLQKGVARSADSTRELKETAMRLQQTLATFGVKVTITDISQGPSVTRYEMQPEQGVKVSKIVGLTDDIKLNLAATDIRIEAPIPGKAAVGIEVPNKENMMVALRDLFESKEFKTFPSNLAFAVGKDIAGQTVVADIAKMPHMLIAGATGSGKSVCINTLIMSILYKAHPDDVKLIMVDPKVVELSVYNGIPHLLIPVVTDPKKAAAALHWGVSEMSDRYKKFADYNVRDLKGYNKKVETMKEQGKEDAPPKMPQIVIIVDELADLMMVSPGEVEESICRLAQLARAAGIHLIIATQRPSVDVITGLIKANMPSRVAFSVSSGVDSRTILDMNGAEKLLGKGDMLFYPQGYSKPARVQGAFVSDKEVSDVVDFIKNQALGNTYAEDVEEQISSLKGSTGSAGGNERDEYFEEAARFIIDKDKASIGMLQRVLKVGFNRAARIMDQLCEYGVVGEEEGTKPRKVLMSTEQFEALLEEI